MSAQTIIIVIAVIIVVMIAASGLRRGPRVTQIDRTVRKEKSDSDA